MKRRLPVGFAGTALAIVLAAILPSTGFIGESLAQGVFPPPPPTGATGIVTGARTGTTGEMSGAPAGAPAGPYGGAPAGMQGGMQGGPPQGGPPSAAQAAAMAKCNAFIKLSAEAKTRADKIKAAGSKHADRQMMCGLVKSFYEAEATVVKFLVDNEKLCGVPPEAVKSSKANHEQSGKFRDNVCAEGPTTKKPTLSEAIGTPEVDTAKNTKTGKNSAGTFDTLTGNPLANH